MNYLNAEHRLEKVLSNGEIVNVLVFICESNLYCFVLMQLSDYHRISALADIGVTAPENNTM